jgi:hypothetical protein
VSSGLKRAESAEGAEPVLRLLEESKVESDTFTNEAKQERRSEAETHMDVLGLSALFLFRIYAAVAVSRK